MPFLLRVALPDLPGSLGRVASAIGEAGGDIEAIEIIEHRLDGSAVDDVLLETATGTMPDTIVSACNRLAGVEVLWIGRYAAGGNLFLDLEAVEELTRDPAHAVARLVEMLPMVFNADWAARVGEGDPLRSPGAPEGFGWLDLDVPLDRPARLEVENDDTLIVAVPTGSGSLVLLARRGGPAFLDSELARLGHLVALAHTIAA